MAVRIAATVGALDIDFVAAALGHPGELSCLAASRIGTGQVAMSLRLELEWAAGTNPGRPTVLIAKIPAPEPESREAARLMRTYELEVGFYRDIAPSVTVPHPVASYAEIDPSTGDFTLLMTLAPGRVGDQLAGCSPLHAAAMVDAVVGLHAPTWGRAEEFAELDWLPMPDPAMVAMRVGAYQMLLPGFEERFVGRVGTSVVQAARWLGEHLSDVIATYRSPLCLTHGDYRLDNVLFSDDPGPSVTVLDWQTLGVGRGASDVAYAIGSGLLPDVRRRHETALLDRYVTGLGSAGVDVDVDAVRDDYRLGTSTGLAMAVIASQLVSSTERGDEMFAMMAERHVSQMTDNDVFSLV